MELLLNVVGLRLIEKKLKLLEPKIAKGIVRKNLRAAAKPILKAAKANCPVLTGRLRKSLKIRVLKKRKSSYALQVSPSKGWAKGEEFYGGFVEFGTVDMPAQPFVRPAFDVHKKSSQKILIDGIKAGLRDAKK